MTTLGDITEKVGQLYNHELTMIGFWEYLEGLNVPRLKEFSRQHYRFVLGSYDGPSTGLCEYGGKIQMFTRFFEGAPLDDEDGLAIQGRLYAIVELTHQERRDLLEYQKACEAYRGYSSTYTNGVRGKNHKKTQGECPSFPKVADRESRKVLAWYGEKALDFNSMILRAL